jgi:hypothetical protein
MRSSIRSLLVACLGASCLVVGPPSAPAQVEDTVVANEAETTGVPAVETAPAEPVGPARRAKGRQHVPIDPMLELADPRTYRLKVVIRISAVEAAVTNVIATGPIPMDWPEQTVRLLSEKISPGAKCTESVLKGQASLIRFQVAKIPQGGSASVERLYEITRYRTKFAMSGEGLKVPKRVPAELKDQVAGEPPGIELHDSKMVSLAKMLRGTDGETAPGETIKGIWNWTRDNVKFENGNFRGALYAVENRCGDCEEMSALFVGLCRLSGIPARTVWVESQQTGHDYPEFYLVDAKGKGHWIPAQVVGPPWFGEMTEYRPIFQKGDRFYDPLQKTFVRYVPHTVKGDDAKVPPKVEFTHEVIADSDINGPSYSNTR